MIGSFLSRALALVLGYAYPAYECFKVVELNKPEIEQLRFWCQYWILVAVLTVFERVGDTFISWLPMYSEAKLAFFVYLWYPKTKGTSYVYDTFFRPYVAKHETEIDRNLLELRTRAGDMVIIYWQRAATYGQTRFFDILQYVASQSTAQSSRPRPAQQRQQPQQTRQAPAAPGPVRQPAVPQAQLPPHAQQNRQAPVAPGAVRQPTVPQTQLPPRVPASPTKSQGQEASAILPAALRAGQSQTSSGSVGLAASETSRHPAPSEVEAMQVEVTSAPSNGDANPASQETPMEEAIRMTRGRLRKRAAAGADSAA